MGEKIPLWEEKLEELYCALFFTTNCFALLFNYVCSLRPNILRFDHTAASLRTFCSFSQLSAGYKNAPRLLQTAITCRNEETNYRVFQGHKDTIREKPKAVLSLKSRK